MDLIVADVSEPSAGAGGPVNQNMSPWQCVENLLCGCCEAPHEHLWRWADCTSAVHDATRYHFLAARCKHLLLGICVIHSIAHRLDTPTFLNARDWRAISHIFD